jgi:hypothetical protein
MRRSGPAQERRPTVRAVSGFLDPTHLIDTFGLPGMMVILFAACPFGERIGSARRVETAAGVVPIA